MAGNNPDKPLVVVDVIDIPQIVFAPDGFTDLHFESGGQVVVMRLQARELFLLQERLAECDKRRAALLGSQ